MQSSKLSSSHARATPPDNPSSALSNPLSRQVFPALVSRAPKPPTCFSARHPPHDTFRLRLRARASGALDGLAFVFERRRRPRARQGTSTSPTLLTYSSRKRTLLYKLCAKALVQGDARTRPASKTNRPRSWSYFIDTLKQHAWLLSSSTASAPEGGGVYFGRPATVHAMRRSKRVIAVDMPPAAAAHDRKRGGAGAFRASGTEAAPG